MCFCLITICFHMPNVFYLFVALLLICQIWPMIGLIKVFYSILFYSILFYSILFTVYTNTASQSLSEPLIEPQWVQPKTIIKLQPTT